MSTRAEATRARLQAAALDLFERRGYRAVTVEEIAATAGVSHMTFFRHFATKERVLLDDPFDPVIAEAVAAQPSDLPAIERVARGMLSLTPLLDQEPTESTRRGIAIAAGVPELQAGMAANTATTARAIVDAAAAPGDEAEMRMAAAACLAAITAALLGWAADGPRSTLGDLVAGAMTAVVPHLADAHVPAFAGSPA
ncbi:TetR/AcrR family transcriptional regulator [Demequina iriomotensis]|uniref:TetR/AcrR family transcriptional regulator n=1 Tax=Demequina iriomotensis TaxID=1536641 RepID=UPI00078517A5|nr:TetR/AcrR family transcriptional regulator [Demequina iriomotensis]